MQIWREKTKVIHLEDCSFVCLFLKSLPCIYLVHLFHGSLSEVSEDSKCENIWIHASLCWAALDWYPQKPAEGLVGSYDTG